MNDVIKAEMKSSRLYHYEIAAQIGISEYSFCKWFRRELTTEQVEQIRKAIQAFVSAFPDKNNHTIDALAYALENLIKRRGVMA